jgi:cellulose synthase/poly-beta-1,6-N-acetylglucosamine synthase-like glycosyltransferase
MTLLGACLAWGAALAIGYVYVGYPVVLALLARWRRQEINKADITPSVSVVISAYNEADVIGNKIKNTLDLDYPRDRMEVIVVSDASTDRTDEIVSSFADKGVILLRMPTRGGKTIGLNAALRVAKHDIVVFSDANIMYRRDTIRRLVANFADPSVGCVTGDSQYAELGESEAHKQENTYWGYERYIRSLESQIGSTVGGDGAIFAIRRELYTPLSPETINDLVTPLQIVLKGLRAVFEPAAVGVEPSAGDFKKEFRRKRRIVNRSWRGVMSVVEVLNPAKVGIFAWQVWSHKMLRWLVLPLLGVAVTGCVLAIPRGFVYYAGVIGFVLSLVLAVLGALSTSLLGPAGRVAQGLFYFYLVNVAAVLGVSRALTGNVETTWSPERN